MEKIQNRKLSSVGSVFVPWKSIVVSSSAPTHVHKTEDRVNKTIQFYIKDLHNNLLNNMDKL